jgi:hypothetical protein
VPPRLTPLIRFLTREDDEAPKLNSLRGRTPAFSSRRADTLHDVQKLHEIDFIE